LFGCPGNRRGTLAGARVTVGAPLAGARVTVKVTPTVSKTVGDIVGAYKSLVANKCLEIFKMKYAGTRAGASPAPTGIPMMGKLWQRNFYEHIIRNEKSYQSISNYIINNPNNWKDDKFYLE